jgi:hypothetical protein
MDTTPQTVFNSPRKKPSTVDRLKSMEFGGWLKCQDIFAVFLVYRTTF